MVGHDFIADNLKQIVSLGFVGSVLGFFYKRHTDVMEARGKHRDDVKAWSDDVIRALTRSGSLYVGVEAGPGNAEKAKLESELSALIDIGRTYFPNDQSEYGKDKPKAFRGHRRRILDWLVCAHDVLDAQDNSLSPASKELVRELRRYFIADRQDAIASLERFGPVTKWSRLSRRRCKTQEFLDASHSHPMLLKAVEFVAQEKGATVHTPIAAIRA
jgi:hypothetical protein